MTRSALAAISLGLLVVIGCSGSEPAEKPRELTPEQLELTGGKYVDPALFPEDDFTPPDSCRIEWALCGIQNSDDHCCYGPCPKSGVLEHYCIGCLPPGMPCIQHEECCGKCSRECSLRDESCSGICLLGQAGDFCHDDRGCLSARCVEHQCR